MVVHRFPLCFRQTASPVCLLFALVVWLGAGVSPLAGQSRLNRPEPKYFQITPPDQKEGAAILEQMRAVGPEGDYYFEFDLRVLPRRGAERRIPGRVWGGRNADGPLSRLSLSVPAEAVHGGGSGGGEAGAVREAAGLGGGEKRILVQGGARPSAWRWPATDGASTIVVAEAALFEPLAGTDLSAFDLQMPFLYWPDFVYEGKTRLQSRPVDTFLLYPPASLAAHRPDLEGMRVYLDPQYHALVRAEQIGAGERVLKSFMMGGLAKIGERWIPRTFELRDETTRNKTRFVVTAAALNLDFSGTVFDPGNLSETLRPPARLTRLPE